MISLYLGVGLLTLLALSVFVYALRPRQSLAVTDLQQEAQRGFYRQRRAEIAEDFTEGLIDGDQRRELETELDRQVLEESAPVQETAPASSSSWLFAAGTGLVLVVAALLLYRQLGHRDDLLLEQLQQTLVASTELKQHDLDRYQGVLEAIIERRPDSAEHLVAMAGLLRERGDFSSAVPYYQKLHELYPQDAEVLAQLGQARYLAGNRQLSADTRALLEQAIALDPGQATALGVLGIDAFAAGDYVDALKYWQPLLATLPAGSQQQLLIAGGVNEAKKSAVEQGSLSGIPVAIRFSEPALAKPGLLFVVAREESGMPMPVAALRLALLGTDQQLVYLTDSDVIREGKRLQDFPKLKLSAHISTSGTAMRRPGDWGSAPVLINSGDAGPVELLVDQQF